MPNTNITPIVHYFETEADIEALTQDIEQSIYNAVDVACLRHECVTEDTLSSAIYRLRCLRNVLLKAQKIEVFE